MADPERQALGDVGDLEVVERACGTAYFSAWLARAGASVVAVDLSGEQLGTARRLQTRNGREFAFVQADAERISLADGTLSYGLLCVPLQMGDLQLRTGA